MKSTKELRAFLVEQMKGVADGSIDPEKAKGVSNLAQQIYNTINIEVRMAIARMKLGEEPVRPIDFDD